MSNASNPFNVLSPGEATMVAGTSVYEHVDTGIRVLVYRLEKTETLAYSDGSKKTVLTGVRWETAAGQCVTPADPTDDLNPLVMNLHSRHDVFIQLALQ